MPAKCCSDFFARIPDDVPVFTLVAYDQLAIDTVQFWIKRAEEEGVNGDKIERARQHLRAMATFESANPGRMKLPD